MASLSLPPSIRNYEALALFFYIQGYFESLREELSSKNIKVTVVCPGLVKSKVLQNALTGDLNQVSKQILP